MSWVCLMYHDVTPEPVQGGGGPARFAVAAHAFARQLDWIAAEGLRGRTVESMLDAAAGGVGISFDDGEAGVYERAFPALAARGMTATFFVTTSWVGEPGYVTWNQLREMKRAGMSIQSHTRTHPFLSELGRAALVEELEGSRRELDAALGQRTRALALPGGDEPRGELSALLRACGYDVVATSRWGTNRARLGGRGDEPARVARCFVRGEPTRPQFRRVVLGDPWLARWQQARGGALSRVRASLTPTRYAALRRSLLGSLAVFR